MLRTNLDLTFEVSVDDLEPGETVLVVGNVPQLGQWVPEKAVQLRQKLHDSNVWSKVIRVPPTEVEYRYLVGCVQEPEHEGDESNIIVRRWETNIHPRKFTLSSLGSESSQGDVAVFGTYGGKTSIDKGWLTGQKEIQLRLFNNPIHMWKPRHRQQTYRVKCTSIDLKYKDHTVPLDDTDESLDQPPFASPANRVTVSVLDGQRDVPHVQNAGGSVYKDNDYMVFRAQTFTPDLLAYQFEFYVHDPNAPPDTPGKYVGYSYLLPVNMKDLTGQKIIPIQGLKNRPIGQLTVDYLIIKPLRGYQCDMSRSFSKYYKRSRGPLDVGHRGMGSSYNTTRCEAIRENTVASLQEAGGHGADLVEFDVQLTKDMVPVIYHDFTVCLTLRKKNSDEHDWFTIPVKDLTLEQLQMLKLDHVSEKSKGSPGKSSRNSSPVPCEPDPTHTPFPTLKTAFEQIDECVGFNVEVKYCMLQKNGELEEGLTQFMERNKYVDYILSDILKYAGNRRIFLSSFDPDVCAMTRAKQNRYPIQLLSNGKTERYPALADIRTQSTPASVFFAHSEQILGVNPHTEDLLKDPSLISQATDLGLIVFCWGEDCNDKQNIKLLKEKGVHGVIYDRIHELKPTKENIFKLEQKAKMDLLKQIGALNTSPDTIPQKLSFFQTVVNGASQTPVFNGVSPGTSNGGGLNGGVNGGSTRTNGAD